MIQRRIPQTLIIFSLFFFIAISPQTNRYSWADSKEEELFFVAQKAFEDGFYDISIRYTTQFLETFPNTERKIQAKLLLGQCYFFKNEYLKAYETFHELLEHSQFKDATLFWLGETYLKGSDYTQADKYYNELINDFPDSEYIPQTLFSLGWSQFERKNYKQAKESFLKLVKNYPNHELIKDTLFKLGECEYNLDVFENAIHYFKDYVVRYSRTKRHPEAYFYIAESYYNLKDFLTASTYYAKAANISSDTKIILMSKISAGWSYLKLKRFERSQKSFEEAKALAEKNKMLSDDILLGLASLYSEMNEHDKALSEYKQLIEQFPNSLRIVEAHLGLANIYYLKKEYAFAIAEYNQTINQYSSNPENQQLVEKAQFGLAWTYLKSGEVGLAIETFKKIVKSATSDIVKVSALTQIADAYHDSNKLERALEQYDKILDEYPNSIYSDYAQFRQGITLLKLNRIKAATLSFQSLQANFPNSKYQNDSRYYLAVAYFKKGDWAMAETHINQYITSLPESSDFSAEAYYILGTALLSQNKAQEAHKIFTQIITNYPEQKAIIKNAEFGIAKSLFQLNKKDEAIKKFNRIAIKYPKSEVALDSLTWLGDYYLENLIFENAIDYYQQIITNFPGSDRINIVYYELGQAHESLDQYDKALFYYSKVNNPKDKEVYTKSKLAIANIFSKKMDFDTAFETYQSIIQHVPDFKRDAYVSMAQVYKNRQDLEKSTESYHQALKSAMGLSKYSDAELQFYIADNYELLNNQSKAVEEYLKIPYLYPRAVPWIIKSYLRIARIFEDADKWDDATAIYEKVIQFKTEESKFAQERLEWIKENNLTLAK